MIAESEWVQGLAAVWSEWRVGVAAAYSEWRVILTAAWLAAWRAAWQLLPAWMRQLCWPSPAPLQPSALARLDQPAAPSALQPAAFNKLFFDKHVLLIRGFCRAKSGLCLDQEALIHSLMTSAACTCSKRCSLIAMFMRQ